MMWTANSFPLEYTQKEPVMNKIPVIISHERFLSRFYYNSETNIMGKNLFKHFGLPEGIVVHRDLAERLYSLAPVLEKLHLKFLFTDAYRPVEMQAYLHGHWKKKTGQEPKFSLADVAKAPHPRGTACDCVLTDENGNKLSFPSSSIKINPEERNPDFEFSENTDENKEKIRNRNLLRTLMLCAGVSPINKEWFHFQLPNTEDYEPVSLEEARKAEQFPYNQAEVNSEFYDIFSDYQNEEAEGKTHFWIYDKKYYERFQVICREEFIAKVRREFNV